MLSATCHCGAVRLEVPAAPEFVVDCNCSICRRYGALWAFYPVADLRTQGHPAATTGYIWGPKTINTFRCRHCGCVTHWEPLPGKSSTKLAINARNLEPRALEGVRVRHFDGADAWKYLD
jgi:hypothetical protein